MILENGVLLNEVDFNTNLAVSQGQNGSFATKVGNLGRTVVSDIKNILNNSLAV
jgi:hypothetical protein